MITRSGQADLPLHTGKVPPWLYERMARMARAIVEAVVADYGKSSFLSKISDPYWFQSLGSVLGMDWHSSGITTSVMGALKQAVNPISKELGLYVCGGRGGYSRRTPDELMNYSDRTGLDGKALVRSSRLTAKVDNTAIQDGFQIYLHSFIISDTGEWSVVQQGMNGPIGMARRYHWHSPGVKSFVEDPHASIVGENMGKILNLTDTNANATRQGILDITRESPVKMIDEIRLMVLPSHHDVLVYHKFISLREGLHGLGNNHSLVRIQASVPAIDGSPVNLVKIGQVLVNIPNLVVVQFTMPLQEGHLGYRVAAEGPDHADKLILKRLYGLVQVHLSWQSGIVLQVEDVLYAAGGQVINDQHFVAFFQEKF